MSSFMRNFSYTYSQTHEYVICDHIHCKISYLCGKPAIAIRKIGCIPHGLRTIVCRKPHNYLSNCLNLPDRSVLDIDIRLLHTIVVNYMTPFDVEAILSALQKDREEREPHN